MPATTMPRMSDLARRYGVNRERAGPASGIVAFDRRSSYWLSAQPPIAQGSAISAAHTFGSLDRRLA